MENRKALVLVIEDNPEDMKRICSCLPADDCVFTTTPSAKEGLRLLVTGGYDLAIIDVELKDGSGLEIVGDAHRADVKTQLVVLTSTHCEYDVAAMGLDNGADDYLLKGKEDMELKAIFRAKIRRAVKPHERKRHTWHDIVFDEDEMSVYRIVDDRPVEIVLSTPLMRMLKDFFDAEGETLMPDYIARHSLHYSVLTENYKATVNQRVNTLCRKLGMKPKTKVGIVGQRGGGYALVH